MLIKLSIENFRSFKSLKEFYTVQRNYKRFTDHIHVVNKELSILKTSGIYGANGSGKTNLFKALYAIKKMIEDPDYIFSVEGLKLLTPFKLNKECAKEETQFVVDFLANNAIYTYEVKILLNEKKIISEQLIKASNNGMAEEVVVFSRGIDANGNITFSYLQDGDKDIWGEVVTKVVPNHALVLSYDIFKNLDISAAVDWFDNRVMFLFPIYEFTDIAYILSLKPSYLQLANQIITFSGIGIKELKIEYHPIEAYLGEERRDLIKHITSILDAKKYYAFKDAFNNACTAVKRDGQVHILKLTCIHSDNGGGDIAFDIDQESRGTIVLLHLIPALVLSYGEGVNYFIDDINTSLHPILLREILGQYLTQNLGSAKGQLIFNSHEDFIMDEKIVRQDELWLTEKKADGETDIFPLSDFANVRHDLSLAKNYLNGKFGGVPFNKDPGKLIFNLNE